MATAMEHQFLMEKTGKTNLSTIVNPRIIASLGSWIWIVAIWVAEYHYFVRPKCGGEEEAPDRECSDSSCLVFKWLVTSCDIQISCKSWDRWTLTICWRLQNSNSSVDANAAIPSWGASGTAKTKFRKGAPLAITRWGPGHQLSYAKLMT